MIKNSIILIIAAIGMANCNNTENTTNNNTKSNALLARDVTVSNPVIIENIENPEFTKSFDRLGFFKRFYDLISDKKSPVYGESYFGDTLDLGNPLASEEIDHQITKYVDTFDLDYLKEIAFWEKWDFDIAKCKLNKKVIGWVPIKVWEKEEGQKKQLTFYIYPKINIKGELIAKDIIYSTNWYYEYPTTYVGFDGEVFLTNIVNGIKNGSIEAYDPIYMVDKTKRKLSIQQIEESVRGKFNPVRLNKNMESFLFIEDWYFDETSFSIVKEVKAIAFVGWDHENDKKKILFFLFPKE